ncbi:IST1-like protein isoform X2 [Zingiber officinale]|uniref:Regulator of Vps4 activity in the MVB pathway protein n=1 Tax=Zingiber officinale TaxID=94328 RepID=A0A8J5GXT8_ZINOF|nr:IST1-like protein isoform X2 [Zingiber officinale]KAG6516235.1 hypothetical protein ZIOFF_026688 [Zingiber officinale]
MGIKKLEFLLGRRRLSKLKPILALALARLSVLRSHHQLRTGQARDQVAHLLQLGHLDRALLRAEQVIKEQSTVEAFEILSHYCHLLTERIGLLQEHKECPEELREATSSLIFASSRCAVELPELAKVRAIFSNKYGKEFASAAVELRNRCRVNPEVIQKLSTRSPSLEVRQRTTKEIAAERGIDLEFVEASDPAEALEVKLFDEGAMEKQPETMHVRREEANSDEILSVVEYEDVVTAAKDAYEAAAFAAAAARVAVKLCRSQSEANASYRPEEI